MSVSNVTAKGFSGAIAEKYIPVLNTIDAPLGIKTLMLSHAISEGFSPGTKAYRTNNPGNIGTSNIAGSVKTYPTLRDGVLRQLEHINGILAGKNKYYPGGANLTLLNYLKIYAPAIENNPATYTAQIVSNFKKQGIAISPNTSLGAIANIGGAANGAEKKKFNTSFGYLLAHFGDFLMGN